MNRTHETNTKFFCATALALLLAVLVITPALATKDYHAERFDVEVDVHPFGDLIVTERVLFRFERFEGGPFSYVFRDITLDQTDGVQVLEASMDGVAFQPGTGAGQVEIESGDALRVTWHFAPTSDAAHEFLLRYRVEGAIRQDPDADRLVWDAIPEEHEYPISRSTIRLIYPSSASMIDTPQLEGVPAQLEAGSGSVTFTAQDVPADQGATVSAAFRPGSLVSAPPAWQARQEAQGRHVRAVLPWGIAAAVVVALVGLIWLLSFAQRQRRADLTQPIPALRWTAPPANVPPALAGRLVGSQTVALGTLFDLARRGVLRIEEGARRWGSRTFTVHRQPALPARESLRPHEQGLLRAVFESGKAERDQVPLSEVASRLSGHSSEFSRPLEAELTAAGWLDAERAAARRRLFIATGLALAGSTLLFLLGLLLGAYLLANAPQVLPLAAVFVGSASSLFVLGFVFVIAGAVFSPLTNEGLQQAAGWRSYSTYLQNVTRGREPALGPEAFERYLPYAASLGLADDWVKFYHKQGLAEVPAWFRALQDSVAADQSFAALMAVIIASNASFTSSGADGGGGGGGGSGGGASGAG